MKIILFIVALIFSLPSLKAQTEEDGRIAQSLNTSDWFELKRVYDKADKEKLMPMLRVFAESMIASQFNQPEKATIAIRELMNTYGNEIGVANMLGMGFLLASNEAKQGKYADAARTLSNIITAFEPHTDSTSLVLHREYEQQYRILAQYQGVNQIASTAEEDYHIPFRLDSIGPIDKRALTIMIPAEVNQQRQDIVFDSGAGVNIVSTKAAERLGLDQYVTPTQVTGVSTQNGTLAVAKEMQLGNLTLKNVPFYVVDISSGVDSIDAYLSHLDMIIGVKFIQTMKEVQIDFEKNEFILPHQLSSLQANETSNMAEGTSGLFVIEGKGNGERLLFNFDTGAGSSTLDKKYYELHKEYLTTHCKVDTLRSAGTGGIRIEQAYILPHFSLEINGTSHTFPQILVATKGSEVDLNYGNLGMDYFLNFKKIIFNTKKMFVRLINE
ncbi:MAG: hypothetical protein E7099_02090 [Mediterranea massiliensis]|nr:hypothetical protein [Mediterranea massiliensis]